ncbi:MAG TPA: glutaminyl-peptide cyclotransferase [Flavobacterium sp.]|nr:glutaminyl-peptide cyclotransferase [Flavobacterium sp.]
MKKYNLLTFISLGIIIANCGSCEKSDKINFSFDNAKLKEQYQPQETVSLGILNANDKKIDSIVYYVNDKNIGSKKGAGALVFGLKDKKLGYQNLKALVYSDGSTEAEEVTGRLELLSGVEPKLLSYTIVNTFPHDTTSFTEGLEFYRDTLFEGTGQYGQSRLLKIDYKTGKVFKDLKLDNKYFGEGITVVGNKIYQLTYKEKTGFIYNADTWKLEKTFAFEKDIEGWGMTNNGKIIYQSDGTEKIWKVDPATQKMIDYVNVYTNSTKIKSVNELELINGKIYGNIWQKDAIAIINPETGAVEGVINLADLKGKQTFKNADVLNGIAYNPRTKTIFVTGKNWDKLFEIRVN